MSEFHILISDGLEENGQAILRAAARVDDRAGIPADELLAKIPGYDALIVRSRTRVNAAVFEAGARLKVVGRAGVGVDNVDLAAAKTHRTAVVNAPLSTTTAVAEHTIALMFALARELPRADAAMKRGEWTKKELLGVELSGKTLGIIGIGNIGGALAKRATALGMRILGNNPPITDEEVRRRGAEPADLIELCARSDFISLNVPLNDSTRNLINAETLAVMKPGVRLVCTARGGVIDEAALLAALEAGRVAGAALDVFSHEPPGSSALVAHPRVIATPHIAGQTAEAQARVAEDIANEVLAALRGEPLRWQVK